MAAVSSSDRSGNDWSRQCRNRDEASIGLWSQLLCYRDDRMFDLPTEPINFADILAKRKESARNSIREASVAEIHTLVTELYPDGNHPFVEIFSKFIEEHRSERIFRGETSDGIGFVYYPRSNNGIWYRYVGKVASVGRLGPNGLKALAEIMAETGRA